MEPRLSPADNWLTMTSMDGSSLGLRGVGGGAGGGGAAQPETPSAQS